MTTKTGQAEVDTFWEEYGALAAKLGCVDASVLLHRDSNSVSLLSGRFTVGTPSASTTAIVSERIVLGEWELVRSRFDTSVFRDLLTQIVAGNTLNLPGEESWSITHSSSRVWGFNPVTSNHASVFGSPAKYAWVGVTDDRLFPAVADHNRFLRAVQQSHCIHDATDLVHRHYLRQGVSADECRYLRFEVEFPLYQAPTIWDGHRATLVFEARSPLNESDMIVKWRSGEGRGTAPFTKDGTMYRATIDAVSGSFEATAIVAGIVMGEFRESRPQAFVDFPNFVDESPELDAESVDYAEYGTKEQTLLRSVKKQVGAGRPYEIVKRDIRDAIWCIERERYKLAAILAGGIVEGVLKSRLAGETDADIQAAFLKAFPSKKAKTLDRMTFQELIGVARERQKLKVDKLYDSVRDWRNFVHFEVERDEQPIDRNTAQIAVRAAIMLLLGQT